MENVELNVTQKETGSVTDRADVLDDYIDVVNIEARRKFIQNAIDEHSEHNKQLTKSFKGGFELDNVINEKLSKYESVDDLRKALKSDKVVNWFFTNDETGEIMEVDPVIPKEKHMEFKRSYLIYALNTEINLKKIEDEQRELDKAMLEFNKSNEDIWKELSENVLEYSKRLRESVPPDHPRYKAIMEGCHYIESAYTMDVLNETLDKYPSIVKHTLEDMKSSRRIKEIGTRYTEKLRRNGINVSLYPMLSTKEDKSVEYICLRPGQYKPGMENLFVFSCIRYFAMETWISHSSVAKFHASLIVVLRKLKDNSLPDDVKEMVMSNISAYLERFQ